MTLPRLDMLCPVPPFPGHTGGTAHMLRMAKQLGRFFELGVFALAGEPQQVAWGPLAEICQEVRALPRGGGATFGLLDPPAVRQDASAALVALLEQRWRARPPAIVQLEFTTMAQYAPLARAAGALVACTAHNLAFLAQLRRARQETSGRRRARRLLGAASLWQYELRALRHCDLVLALGPADATELRRWLPGLPVVVLPTGVDLAAWPAQAPTLPGGDVLFVGNYDHPPNLEGARWLAEHVWPLVLQHNPAARLTLAGRRPPPALQALASEYIHIPGELPDLAPLYARAALVVAPIFWGSGVRVKLVEALASGLPVVSTRLAAEGLRLQDGVNVLFAEDAPAFASAILRLLAEPGLRERLGAAGRATAERNHDWARIGQRLAGLYAGMLARRGTAL